MVQQQRDKWPWTDKRRKFNPSKTRYDDLKAALLNPKLGFTTASPSTIVDDGTADADEGVEPARHVHPPALGPLATAAGDHACNINPGCPLSIGAEYPPVVQHQTVRVLIEDQRPILSGLPISKSIEVMDLDVVDTVSCGPGEWHASANQLISRLQASCAAIDGEPLPAVSMTPSLSSLNRSCQVVIS